MMSLDRIDVVDAMGVDRESGAAILNLIDSWSWEEEHEQAHLAALVDKFNRYLGFVESGEIYQAYPAAEGRSLEILITGRFEPSAAGLRFMAHASEVAASYDVKLKFQHRPWEPDREISD